jgi:hypothetical protein
MARFGKQDKQIMLRISKEVPYHNDKKKENYLTVTTVYFSNASSTKSSST